MSTTAEALHIMRIALSALFLLILPATGNSRTGMYEPRCEAVFISDPSRATGSSDRNSSKKPEIYNPARYVEKLGVKIDKIEQKEIPLVLYSDGFASHKVAVVRRYHSKNLITEVVTVEQRLGVHPELVRRAMNEGLWPVDGNGQPVGAKGDITYEE